jgi:hypothetical protein
VIPEIDIWRAANLMLKRYGEKAFDESSTRADAPKRRACGKRSPQPPLRAIRSPRRRRDEGACRWW